ncbi:hypothetical protein GCM10028791_12830 [Echinicola sediminis]
MLFLIQIIIPIAFWAGFSKDHLRKGIEPTDKVHRLIVDHPALENGPQEIELIQKEGVEGKSLFYTDVESVLCADHLCKVVPVRLFWNLYGEYQKYELLEGAKLEKGQGEPFEEHDYGKLNKILKNPNSAFQRLSYADITQTKVHGEVDAISGATAIILEEEEAIIGAAWTCYTLWHWANGGIQDVVREIVGRAFDQQDLLLSIQSTDQKRKRLALEAMRFIDHLSPEFIELLGEVIPDWDVEEANVFVPFLEKWTEDIQFTILDYFLDHPNEEVRIKALKSTAGLRDEAKWLRIVGRRFMESTSFQEIDIILTYLAGHNSVGSDLLDQMITCLSDKNNLISRRIYYFLESRSLNSRQKKMVEKYEKQHFNLL